MENKRTKCSFKEHKGTDAIVYCQECRINMCNKCSLYHKGLLENHNLINIINENMANIFTGFCQELNHPNKLNYFCKDHNKLCCANCITKIKEEGDGQHKDCNVCSIKNIFEEKRNKLKENINYLEDLSKVFDKSIEEIKYLLDKIEKDKEELKIQIQKIFTKLRAKLNEREEQLLLDIDDIYTKNYCDEKIIRESEKLPNKIKSSLEKGKLLDKEWDINNENYKLISHINDCLNIENNIKQILLIIENIKKVKNRNSIKINFFPEEKGINGLINIINEFGKVELIDDSKYELIFKENPQYSITGENKNILTKIGRDSWIGILAKNELKKPKIYKWKIRILNNVSNYIRVGIVPKDYNISTSSLYSCGWCFYNFYPALYSGPPYNYNKKETNLSQIKNEIIIVANTEKGTLKFIVDKVDKGDSFNNISFEQPFVPVIFLYSSNYSVEVTMID